MKYFAIYNSWNRKILGVGNPSDTVRYNTSTNNPDYIGHMPIGHVADSTIVPNVILKTKAKVNDLIFHPSVLGLMNKLVISSKLKEVLEQSSVSDVQFLKSNLIQNGKEIENYWILHPCRYHMESIDFPNSEIYISGVVKDHKLVAINSLLHFKELQEELSANGYMGITMPRLRINKIIIRPEVNRPLLILDHSKTARNFYVSEELKNSIEESDCTGIEFMPSDITKDDFLNEDGYRHNVYGYWPD